MNPVHSFVSTPIKYFKSLIFQYSYLGSSSDQCRPTNINIFNAILKRYCTCGDLIIEWVQIDYNHIECPCEQRKGPSQLTITPFNDFHLIAWNLTCRNIIFLEHDVITLLQYLIEDCIMNLRTHQCHVLSVLSDDAPGLFAQEYHHVYWGAMFLLSHQAEMTQRVSGYGNVQFILLLKALSMIVDSKTHFFCFK